VSAHALSRIGWGHLSALEKAGGARVATGEGAVAWKMLESGQAAYDLRSDGERPIRGFE